MSNCSQHTQSINAHGSAALSTRTCAPLSTVLSLSYSPIINFFLNAPLKDSHAPPPLEAAAARGLLDEASNNERCASIFLAICQRCCQSNRCFVCAINTASNCTTDVITERESRINVNNANHPLTNEPTRYSFSLFSSFAHTFCCVLSNLYIRLSHSVDQVGVSLEDMRGRHSMYIVFLLLLHVCTDALVSKQRAAETLLQSNDTI